MLNSSKHQQKLKSIEEIFPKKLQNNEIMNELKNLKMGWKIENIFLGQHFLMVKL